MKNSKRLKNKRKFEENLVRTKFKISVQGNPYVVIYYRENLIKWYTCIKQSQEWTYTKPGYVLGTLYRITLTFTYTPWGGVNYVHFADEESSCKREHQYLV